MSEKLSPAMKILYFVVSLGLLTSWAGPAAARDAECFLEDARGRRVDLGSICANKSISMPRPQFVSAPIRSRRGNTPVIAVTFNGNQTFDMIVDTGATATVITQQMASALGVRPFTSIRAQVADGSMVSFPVGVVESMGVGTAVVHRLPVAIATQIPFGLLGNDFLNSYDVKIRRDRIELHPRN